MVYTITLTNPLASGHDGSWKVDLLMECVVGTPADTLPSPLANGDPSPPGVGRDHRGADGGAGGPPTGANGSGGGASADSRSSQQQPHTSEDQEVDDISSDDDDDDDGGGGGGGGGGDSGTVPDTSPQEADHMDASEISEDEDVDDDDGTADEADDALSGNLHQTVQRAGKVAGGVGDVVRTDSGAAVDMTSFGTREQDEQLEDLDLSSQRQDPAAVERAAKNTHREVAAAGSITLSTSQQQQQQQQQATLLSSSEEQCSSEDETITKAVAELRKQPGLPTLTQPSGLNHPRQDGLSPLAPSPPPSPPASPAISSSSSSSSVESVMSKQTADSVWDDGDSAFDGSDESSWGSEGETDDDDSDGYEVDVLPPTNCFSLHQDRKTYKKALCYECYVEYEEALKKVDLDMSDIDSDTGRRKKTPASRRREKKRTSGVSRGGGGGEKRPRKSRESSSGGNSSGDRKKRRKVGAASVATAGSVSSSGRRLVKPLRKKAKKLAAGGNETASNARLLEDTTSSSSEGGGRGEGARRRGKGKIKKADSGPSKKKQGKGSEGVDLLGALIGNPAPSRKKTNLSTAVQAAPAAHGECPKLVRHRSADAFERRGSGNGAPSAAIGSGGGPPQLARGGSLDTATSPMSLAQYRGGVLRKETPRGPPSSVLRKPGTSVAGSKAAKAAPSGGVGKKMGAEHARPGSKTTARKSGSTSTSTRGISKHAPTTPAPAPSNKTNEKFERVTQYIGVQKKKSNGKYFLCVQGALVDGEPYETAEECAKAYDELHYGSAKRNSFRSGAKKNFSDSRAPSHVESEGVTALNGTHGSRLSKGTLMSGYKPQPFFAPTEPPPQAKPAQAPPRQRPAGAARGQQPREVAARAAQPRPSRQQHGALAAMALIDVPSTGRSSKTSRTQNAPLAPVDAFDTPRISKITWSEPICSNVHLNGRCFVPKASKLPGRSGLTGGRKGRTVPDTRAFCAQKGNSGKFAVAPEDDEEEGKDAASGGGAETTQLSPEEAIAPARGSLLTHDSDGDSSPCHDNDGFEENDSSPEETEAPAMAPTAFAVSSTAAISRAPPPSRAESPGLQATEAAEENGDEEQGRELMMSFIAGSPDEGKRGLTTISMAGAAAAEEDDGMLAGEEEQGRELMMRMAAGADAPPPAVSPAEEEEDQTVPPSPSSAAESDDDGSSGEDEDDAEMSFADEPPPPVIEWKRPKLTSASVGGGDGGGGGGGGGGSGTPSAKQSSPGRSSTSTTTVAHKPALTIRSFTRFSGISAAAAPVPGASTTGPLSSSCEGLPQLPMNNEAQDARTMPAPPNPLLSISGPVQRVVWKTPRQTAKPAAGNPSSSLAQQQQEQVEEDDEDSPLELELPSEIVDALNPPAVRVWSTDTPSTSWRQPARSDRGVSRPARHQALHHVVPPAASTSPPSSVSSAAASPPSGERAGPTGRGSKPLPRFGLYPFRPADERDNVPQSQLNLFSNNAKRLPRHHQREANGRTEVNGVPLNGRALVAKSSRPVLERRSTSSSSGPTSRESSSRSSSRSTNASRPRGPDYPPPEGFRPNPRDEYGRGSEGRGRRDPLYGSNRSRSTGPGGRMVGDRGDRPTFGRDERGSGGFSNNRDARERHVWKGGRFGGDDSDRYRGRQPEKAGGWEGVAARRSEYNDNRSRSRHRRGRSRSPQRERRMG